MELKSYLYELVILVVVFEKRRLIFDTMHRKPRMNQQLWKFQQPVVSKFVWKPPINGFYFSIQFLYHNIRKKVTPSFSTVCCNHDFEKYAVLFIKNIIKCRYKNKIT